MEYIPQCTLTGVCHPNKDILSTRPTSSLQFVCAFTPNTEQSLACFFFLWLWINLHISKIFYDWYHVLCNRHLLYNLGFIHAVYVVVVVFNFRGVLLRTPNIFFCSWVPCTFLYVLTLPPILCGKLKYIGLSRFSL